MRDREGRLGSAAVRFDGGASCPAGFQGGPESVDGQFGGFDGVAGGLGRL